MAPAKVAQRVTLLTPPSSAGTQEIPTLAHNTRLRTLEIDGLVLPGCVSWASSLLSSLRSPLLSHLSISLLVLRREVLASFEWAALDAALARAELAGVELKVTLSRALHPENDPAAIRAAVVGFLPRAEERGVLCVRCA